MKVLMVITVELGKNGIATCVLNYSAALRRQGVETDIVAPTDVEKDIKERLDREGIRLYETVGRDTDILRYWNRLKKIIKKGKYDIVHIHGNSATMAIELTAAFAAGCRVRIAHSHNTTCEHQKAHKFLKPIFDRMYTQGVACGTEAGRWLFGKKAFTVIRNGIQTEKYQYNASKRKEIRERLGITKDQILLGHVGIFNYQKNQEFLVKIFAKLQERDSRYRLVFVGDGETRTYVTKLAEELQVQDAVKFVGNVGDTAPYLSAMDLFVLPSRFEGLPYVLIEAQAAALPCLVSGAVTRESDVTGLVNYVDGFDENIWTEAVIRHKKRHDAENCPQITEKIINSGYDMESNAELVKKFYEKCREEQKK